MALDQQVVKRIVLARHLYELAVQCAVSPDDIALYSAVNLLQDAVEAFLLALSDHVNADIDQNTKFDKYFQLINQRIAPRELPFRARLLRLNRIRIDSKHFGIQPARNECETLVIAAKEFFDEVTSSEFGVSFSTISAVELLSEGETRQLLLDAKQNLEDGALVNCVINCRKALYLEVEWEYDISEFREGHTSNTLIGFLGGPYSKAPFYACNSEYITKNVHCPTDYVVIDHGELERSLLANGVDPTTFWNLLRLTPAVWRSNEDKRWYVKKDFDLVDDEFLQQHAHYIFTSTVDVVLAIHTKKKNIRSQGFIRSEITLKRECVPVYEKADRTSSLVGYTPDGMLKIRSDFSIEGLSGDGPYWRIMHYDVEHSIFGYIHNDDVQLSTID